MTAPIALPTDVFGRWRTRNPQEAQQDPDPRGDSPCPACGTTLTWRGYDLCGWCYEDEQEK